MINNIYTPSNNLKLNARRVERLGKSFRPTIGDSDQSFDDEFRDKSYAELRARLEQAIENESGYRNRLNPKIAVALTAANARQPKPIKAANDVVNTYKDISKF